MIKRLVANVDSKTGRRKMEKIQMLVQIMGLMFNSILDIRKRQISLMVTAIIAFTGIIEIYLKGQIVWWEIMVSLLPGMLCVFLAYVSAGKIGYGDAWILLALGIVLGAEGIMVLSIVAIFAAGATAMVLLLLFHKDPHYEIPFVPFIMLGYLWVRCMT